MINLINTISIFIFNFLISYITFSRVQNIYPEIILSSLENIRNDLSSIGFPNDVNLNIYFIIFTISLFNTLFWYIFVYRNLKINEATDLLKYFGILFFINLGVSFFFLYFLRFFDISRGVLLLNLLSYPFLLGVLMVGLNYFKNQKEKRRSIVLAFVVSIFVISSTTLFFVIRSADENVSLEFDDNSQAQVEEENNNYSQENLENEAECFPWKGSDNFEECIFGSESNIIQSFEEQVNNLIYFDENLYILLEKGLIYSFDGKDSNLFLDISDRVLIEESGEEGLFGIAFHPNENYFLVTYSNLSNSLTVDKYNLVNDKASDNNYETILQLPNSQCCHWGGNIIWSEYFQDFILSIGDMESNERALLNFEPLDTTSLRGKLILLNTNNTNSPLISSSNTYMPLSNIVAYGLRNPWKTIEYDNKLFIVDIGLANYEELNVVDLNLQNKDNFNSVMFGWPVYEGPFETIDIYTIEVPNEETSETETYGFNGALSFVNRNTHYTEVNYWIENEPQNSLEYIKENSQLPNVYYDHTTPLTIRAAMIGGDIIKDKNSKYENTYFFSDFLTKEIFGYNYIKNEVFIFPQKNLSEGFVTSLIVNPYSPDSVIISTSKGELVNISLP